MKALKLINKLAEEFKLEYREYIGDKGYICPDNGLIIEVKNGSYGCELKDNNNKVWTGIIFRDNESIMFTEKDKEEARFRLLFLLSSKVFCKSLNEYICQ